MIFDDYAPHEIHDRLRESYSVLRRAKMEVGPGGLGSGWPQFRREWADLIAAVEGGHEIGWRFPSIPTPDEVSRMEEAIEWPVQYLKDCDTHRKLILAYYAYRYYLKLGVETIRRTLRFKITRTMHRHRMRAVTVLTNRINQNLRLTLKWGLQAMPQS